MIEGVSIFLNKIRVEKLSHIYSWSNGRQFQRLKLKLQGCASELKKINYKPGILSTFSKLEACEFAVSEKKRFTKLITLQKANKREANVELRFHLAKVVSTSI